VNTTQPSQRPWRFSLRSALIGTACFAVWCSIVVVLPQSLNLLLIGLLWTALAGLLVTGLVFARGKVRAFCIGATIVYASMWTRSGGMLMEGLQQLAGLLLRPLNAPDTLSHWIDLGLLSVIAFANGQFCVLAKCWFERWSADSAD
jgi:hypothetical protein